MTNPSSKSKTFNGTTGTDQGSAGAAVQDLAGQAKDQVGQAVDQVRTQATSQLSGQKDRAAQGLGSVAQALRHTSGQLRDQDQGMFTQYVDNVADRIEQFSSYVQERDVGELVGEVERFARREPTLFLGGAFVLGLLGARFLKSSNPNAPQGAGYPLARYEGYPSARVYGQRDVTTYRTDSPSYSTGATYGTGTQGTTGTAGTSSYPSTTGTRDTGDTEKI